MTDSTREMVERLEWRATVLMDHVDLFTKTAQLLREAANNLAQMGSAINERIAAEQHFDGCVCPLCKAVGR